MLEYDEGDSASLAEATDVTVFAPHGTLTIDKGGLHFISSSNNGLSLSSFLSSEKSELDITLYDVLFASVSLLEKFRETCPSITGGELDIYVEDFYRTDDKYTVIFGLSDSSIPISGDAFPYLAKFSVSNNKFSDIELHFISAERVGYTSSAFPSAWEYDYAKSKANVKSLSLRYKADTLPITELDANWFFTVNKTEVKP